MSLRAHDARTLHRDVTAREGGQEKGPAKCHLRGKSAKLGTARECFAASMCVLFSGGNVGTTGLYMVKLRQSCPTS
jgi:hypothetical protein